MNKIIVAALICLLYMASVSHAGFLENLLKGIGSDSSSKGTDESTVISGLKEALSVSTKNAVNDVSKIDGYLSNEAIKILMPEEIQNVANVLSKIGYRKQVDDFITSMNRAAENAAPKASSHFMAAIKEITFEDGKKILDGGDTAATDYFRGKTSEKPYRDFRPIISSSMNNVGATRSYKEMMGKYTSLPFMKEETFDLDHYVTEKSLDGLFHMIAEEEKKIRTEPAARVTDLLKKVFGK